jgi:predicted ATPase
VDAAARAAGAFLHGAGFVALGGAGSLHVLPGAIAEGVGLSLSGKAEPREQLLGYLRDKDLLLVLDNLEHLAGAGQWVGDLAAACPDVRLIVTSRERLNLHGERLLELGGLAAPPEAAGEAAGDYDAVRLFLTSARAAHPSFAPAAGELRAVGRICRMVDGLPLAIELAAAWARHLSCAEIAGEIGRSLSFLATAQRNVPPRHRSLEAAFEHSWALLLAEERQAFARLAVFRGGCTRAAALAVTQHPAPVLAALCDKSLLRRGADGRYALHELLRQFAERKLGEDSAEAAAAQARHCAHYVDVLGAHEDALSDARQAEARAALVAEADNVRAAWAWAVAHQPTTVLAPALESARIFFEHVGWYAEAAALFGAAAEAERSAGRPAGALYARLLARQAWFYHRLDRFDAAQALIEQCLPLFEAAAPPLPAEAGLCRLCLANMARAVGEFTRSRDQARQALALYRLGGNPRPIAAALNAVAVALAEVGDYAEAERLHREGLALRRALGDRRGVATALVNLGFIGLGQGQYTATQDYEREALAIFRELGYPMGEAVALNNLAVAYYYAGDHQAARPLLEDCVALCRDLGHRHIAAHALASLGAVTALLGDVTAGWRHIGEAMQMAGAISSVSARLSAVVNAAVLLGAQGQWETAASLLAFARAHPAANQEAQNRVAELLASAAAHVPAPALAAAQARGRAHTLDTAMAELRAVADRTGAGPPGRLPL